MRRFYGHLKEGVAKDEALRRAEVELLHGSGAGDLSHPFSWAAFELIGDWR
jgi:CHAT domain-containing protein